MAMLVGGSLFARLTKHSGIAILLSIATRAYIATKQVGVNGIAEHGSIFVFSAVIANAAGCVVFARFGLVPAMLLAAGLGLNVFFQRG